QHSRFAAADMSSPAFRPKAISWVMTGGMAAAVFGTLLVMGTTDLLAPVTFAGCYAAMVVLCAAAMVVLSFLDIPDHRTTAAAIAIEGIKFENFALGLILLGLGWNFGFIGGTTLLTHCYQPAEANKVQAFNDFAVFATVACASLVSGQLLASFGWMSVNIAVYPLVLVALALIGWLALRREAPRAIV